MEELIYKAYKDQGIVLLNVFIGSTDDDIKKFAATFNITSPVGRDNGMTQAFHITGIPVTVFIGKDGEITRQVTDTIKYKDLDSGIKELLQ